MPIPKNIHQVWINHIDIPLDLYDLSDMQSWKILNPEWKYWLWDRTLCDNIITTFFPEIAFIYSKVSYGLKSDICRVALLILFGGIYADLDTKCLKSFDALTDEIKTIRNEGNSFIMSPVQSVYLKLFMEHIIKNHDFRRDNKFAGPSAYEDFERTLDTTDILSKRGHYCERIGYADLDIYAIHTSKTY